MFKTLKEAFKIKEIRNKILLTLLLLLIYRIGCWLPVPGILVSTFQAETGNSDFLGIISAVSGNALSNGAILALGVVPYINASIIIQLLTVAIPALERISKQGEDGKKKISLYTRIAALVLAFAQAIGIVASFGAASLDTTAIPQAWLVGTIVVLILVAGAMFTVWLGEKITNSGVGNGLSLLIFVGLLSSAGQAIFENIAGLSENIDNIWNLLIFLAAVIVIFGLIVWVDTAERKIPVQYAKQIKGRKMYGGQSTNIPIKVNATGVMPIIFANAFLAFPQLIMSIFWYDTNPGSAYMWYSEYLGAGSWAYGVLTAVLILLFAYFYSRISFNPEDISRQMQQNGGFIHGYRAGKPTAEYLQKVSDRITLFGAIFLAFIALVPTLVFTGIGGSTGSLVNAFSATGLLIVVSVALELEKQLEAQMLTRNYKGFLK